MPGEKFEGLGITTIMHFTAVLRRVACQGSSLWKGRESNSLFGAALPLASRGLFTWRADDGDCWSRRCTLLFSPLENSAWMRNYSSRKFTRCVRGVISLGRGGMRLLWRYWDRFHIICLNWKKIQLFQLSQYGSSFFLSWLSFFDSFFHSFFRSFLHPLFFHLFCRGGG